METYTILVILMSTCIFIMVGSSALGAYKAFRGKSMILAAGFTVSFLISIVMAGVLYMYFAGPFNVH